MLPMDFTDADGVPMSLHGWGVYFTNVRARFVACEPIAGCAITHPPEDCRAYCQYGGEPFLLRLVYIGPTIVNNPNAFDVAAYTLGPYPGLVDSLASYPTKASGVAGLRGWSSWMRRKLGHVG